MRVTAISGPKRNAFSPHRGPNNLSSNSKSERTIAVQAICIPLNFLMLSVGILMAGVPTQQTFERRILLLYFAAKTLLHHLPLFVGHVPRLCKNYFQTII